jgi:hypothetical protein
MLHAEHRRYEFGAERGCSFWRLPAHQTCWGSVGTSRPSRLLAAPGPEGVVRLFVLIQSLWFTFVFVRFGPCVTVDDEAFCTVLVYKHCMPTGQFYREKSCRWRCCSGREMQYYYYVGSTWADCALRNACFFVCF